MSICINPNDKVWQKVLSLSPNPEVAFNVMKGNYDLSKEEEFKNYVSEEADKYYHFTDIDKFYSVRGFNTQEISLLKNASLSLQELLNSLSDGSLYSKLYPNEEFSEEKFKFIDKLNQNKNKLLFYNKSAYKNLAFRKGDDVFFALYENALQENKDLTPDEFLQNNMEKVVQETVDALMGMGTDDELNFIDEFLYNTVLLFDHKYDEYVRPNEMKTALIKHISRGILEINSEYEYNEIEEDIVEIFGQEEYKKNYNVINSLKVFFRNIPEYTRDTNGNNIILNENGFPKFLNESLVIGKLLEQTHSSDNVEHMLKKLETASKNIPWMNDVYQKLISHPSYATNLWLNISQRTLSPYYVTKLNKSISSYSFNQTQPINWTIKQQIEDWLIDNNSEQLVTELKALAESLKTPVNGKINRATIHQIFSLIGLTISENELSLIPEDFLISLFEASTKENKLKSNLNLLFTFSKLLYSDKKTPIFSPSSISKFTREVSPYLPGVPIKTIININKEKIYPYIFESYVYKLFRNIKTEWNKLTIDPFYKNSLITDLIPTIGMNSDERNLFEVGIESGLEIESKDSVVEYSNLKPFEYVVLTFQNFLNSNKYNPLVKYLVGPLADSGTGLSITLPNFSKNLWDIDEPSEHPFVKIYEQELSKKQRYFFDIDEEKARDMYDRKQFSSLISYLRTEFEKDGPKPEDKGILVNNRQMFIDMGFFEEIEDKKTGTKLLVFNGNQSYLKIPITYSDAYLVNNNVSKEAVENEGLVYLEPTKGNNPTQEANRYTNQIQSREYNKILNDFIYSDFIARTQIITATSGHPSYYKNLEDFMKRNKQIWSTGIALDTTRIQKEFGQRDFKALFLADVKNTSLDVLSLFGIEKTNPLYNHFKETLEKSEITDGMTFISPKADMMQRVGMNTDTKEFWDLYNAELNDTHTKASKNIIGTVWKPFTFGMFQENENTIRPYQLKTSEHRLSISMVERATPEFQRDVAIPLGFYKDGNKWKWSDKAVVNGKTTVDKVVYRSSDKLKTFPINSIQTLPFSDWRLQQATPNKLGKDDKLGVQIMKLLMGAIDMNEEYNLNNTKTKGDKLFNEYNSLLKSMFDKGSENFEKFLASPVEVRQRVLEEMSNMQETLKDAVRRGVNLSHPLLKSKIEPLLYSIQRSFINEVNLPVSSLYNASGIAYTTDLKIIKGENGELIYEAILPVYDKKMLEHIMVDDIIDMSKISDEMLHILGYRIPTEREYSMMHIKVKGFSDMNSGASIYLPAEITAIAGLDFDIDKIFALIYNWNIKDGKISKIPYLSETNSTIQERYEQYNQKNIIKADIERLKGNIKKILSEDYEFLGNIEDRKDSYKDDLTALHYRRKELTLTLSFLKNDLKEPSLYLKELQEGFMGDDLSKASTKLMANIGGIFGSEVEILETIEREIDGIVQQINTFEAELEEIENNIKTLPNNAQLQKEIDEKIEEKKKQIKPYEDEINYLKEKMRKAQNENENISLEEFKSLSILDQNTKKAKQNYLVDMLYSILDKKPENILNVAGYERIRTIAENILKAQGKTKELRNIAALNMQVYTKQMMDAGKKLIGPFANANTFHAIIKNIPFEMRIGGPLNVLDKDIYKNISMLLSMVVDNGKDPLAHALNLNMSTVNVAVNYLLQGHSLEETFEFLASPILVEWQKTIDTNIKGESAGQLYEKFHKKAKIKFIEKEKVLEMNTFKKNMDRGEMFHFYIAYSVQAQELANFISALKVGDKGVGKNTGEMIYNSGKKDYISPYFDKNALFNSSIYYPYFYRKSFEVAEKLQSSIGIHIPSRIMNFFTEIPGVRADDINKLLTGIESYYISNLFTEERRNYLLKTMPIKLEQVKKEIDNIFLSKLAVKLDPFSVIKFYSSVEDPGILDMYEDAWLELYYNEKYSDFARELMDYALMLNQATFSPQSFSFLIPKEILFDLTFDGKTIEENKKELQMREASFTFFKQYIRQNTPKFVKKVKFNDYSKNVNDDAFQGNRIVIWKGFMKDFKTLKDNPQPVISYKEKGEDFPKYYFLKGSTGEYTTYEYESTQKHSYISLYNINGEMMEINTLKEKLNIYSQLGKGEHIVYSNIKTIDGKYDRDANIAEAKKNGRVYTMETNNDVNSFSNPWASFDRAGTIKTASTKESVLNYIDWLTTDKFNDIKPERKAFILEILRSGKLKGKELQYYVDLKQPSHATALDYLINKYNWNNEETDEEYSIFEAPVFNSLPSPSFPTMTYAGIGSRETPQEVLDKMTEAAKYLETLGYTLRSGAAPGADAAFEKGVISKKEIFPGNVKTGERELKIAEEIHPAWDKMLESTKTKAKAKGNDPEKSADYVANLMARNTNQIFGANLDTPVDFVLFYAEDKGKKGKTGYARPEGGTGQAVEMARAKGIPTINMANANWRQELSALLNKSKENNIPSKEEKIVYNNNGLTIIENGLSEDFAKSIVPDLVQQIESQSYKQTKSASSYDFGTRWTRMSDDLSKDIKLSFITGMQLSGYDITQEKLNRWVAGETGASLKLPPYGYNTLDQYGNPLKGIPPSVIIAASNATGLDLSSYQASYNSVYDNNDQGNLIFHQDNTEQISNAPIVTLSLGLPMKFVAFELKNESDYSLNNQFIADPTLPSASDALKDKFINPNGKSFVLSDRTVLVFDGKNRNVGHKIQFDPSLKGIMPDYLPEISVNKAFTGLNQKDRYVKTKDYRTVLTLRKIKDDGNSIKKFNKDTQELVYKNGVYAIINKSNEEFIPYKNTGIIPVIRNNNRIKISYPEIIFDNGTGYTSNQLLEIKEIFSKTDNTSKIREKDESIPYSLQSVIESLFEYSEVDLVTTIDEILKENEIKTDTYQLKLFESTDPSEIDENITPCDTGGDIKAAHGLKPNDFKEGGTWTIIEEFKGPSHEQGGIDITIKK